MPQIASRLLLILILFICLTALASLQCSDLTFNNHKMGIVHIVLFEFKSDAKREDIKDACQRMLALKEQCLHPTTNKPYVKSAIGGSDVSPEGLQNGITHGFVVQFENNEDRKYYLEKDPAHLGFVKSIGGVVAKAQVVDFVPGVFD